MAVRLQGGLLATLLLVPIALGAQGARRVVPYSDVAPIIAALRGDLLPPDLRGLAPEALAAAWPDWIARRNADIRGRVAAGDEDSVVHLLLFGTSFTKQPPISEQELAGIVVQGRGAPAFVASRVLKARIGDFIAALASPGADERLAFARQVVERGGMSPAAAADRDRLVRYLEERAAVVGRAERRSRLLDPANDPLDKLTIFRDRGLSSDTSVAIDFGIEQTLEAMKTKGAIRAENVRRAAIVGPGLDFVDKQNGYDFYPPQTLQPFALIDSLVRVGLSDAARLQVTAFDVNPRVIAHLDRARQRADTGAPYALVLARNLGQTWNPELVEYWRRLGNWIGEPVARVPAPPPGAGRVEVRGLSVRPSVVLSVTPADLNIVAERIELPEPTDQFDLIVATNILLYYDVFEQSLAAANLARMLRRGGFLLTNNRIFELPGSPLSGVGYTDSTYMSLPGVGEAGDRIIWYQKQ